MNLVPHVDVVGEDRLQAILDDTRNFNLRAFRAETILDWIPDLGTYTAPSRCRSQNGLHRTPGLAASGLPAVLRHRFWEPEDREQIVGTRYIGLLIYDSEEDDYTFELSTGSDPIGMVRPWRHDNRRHLIVAEKPADILGGHIPFQVRAVGKGPCYLESVVFLPQCPEPSSFAPETSRLQAQIVSRSEGIVTAEVHFLSREAATALVEAVPMEGAAGEVVRGQTQTFERLHAVVLSGLQDNCRYQVNITATERGGATASASLTLDTSVNTGDETELSAKPLAVPVEILRSTDMSTAGMPMTFGVPVPQGRVIANEACTLRCHEELLPAQTRVHAQWPDGSAKWVLVDVPCPDVLNTHTPLRAELQFDAEADKPAQGLSYQVDEETIQVEGEHLRVTVSQSGQLPACIELWDEDNGWQDVFGSTEPCLVAQLGNGLQLSNGPLEELALQEMGAERAAIQYELPLVDTKGIAHLRTTVRIHVYARMQFVRLQTRTVVISPALAPAFGAQNLDHLTPELAHVRDAVVSHKGEGASLLQVRNLELRLPWREQCDDVSWRVVHEHDRAYRVERGSETEQRDGHRSGAFTLCGAGTELALCVKHFWQTYPKAVRHDGKTVAVEILPPLSGEAPPDCEELWHKLYSWYDPDRALYRLKTGMALTVEMLVGFPADDVDVSEWQAWLECPPVVRSDLDYLNSTSALLPIASKDNSPSPRYEALMDAALEVWTGLVDERHEYGFANFGDTYSDSEWFWSNNEYDATLCHYVEFLRSGVPGWFHLGSRTARHLVDIDTCNYSSEAEQIGAQYMHIPGHAGGFLPPYFRCKIAGSVSKPSHSWVEGAILHYLLTGDETVRSVLEQTSLQFTRDLRYYDFFNARECGWHLIHLCGLARLDNDPRLLNAATIIAHTVLEKQEPAGGWEHPLSEAHCHCEPPRCHGEAGFMVGVLLAGLRRYHALTGDARVAEAIVGGAKWLAKRTFVREAGVFRYTSCPNRKNPAAHGRQLVEGLATAYALEPHPEIADALWAALTDLGEEEDARSSGDRYGRSISTEARYTPMMLSLLPNQQVSPSE